MAKLLAVVLIAALVAYASGTACPHGKFLNEYTLQDYAKVASIPVEGAKYQILRVRDNNADPVPADWIKPSFDDSTWQSAVLPFGDRLHTCATQLADRGVLNTVGTSWKVGGGGQKSVLFVRDRFELPKSVREQLGTIKGLKLEYIVDNDIVHVGLNGQNVLASKKVRDNCSGVTRPDTEPLDVKLLKDGENIVTMHVEDRGSMSYFNYRIVVEVCEDEMHKCDKCH
mmetsp:Transcript_11178/g.30059  ORF Transcript_11178/g.30059 Transcript_11178/m.30059 type:complete len:227 (-) Transcript_11178:167-847(-)|eukprot:CAMPEP_0185833312 /NCGR_PEP_ID=MMETSP1353-20130828/2587_1 /TAXON_ID=1077150 /ORGANISM="Erythrolobus australicus, Strain CCMP3124" /LENGTH=226 /DNA_ID=CAMNT_0028531579 /DNA_START=160 /DNA_END=840 /DNA_ORIENTATION=-